MNYELRFQEALQYFLHSIMTDATQKNNKFIFNFIIDITHPEVILSDRVRDQYLDFFKIVIINTDNDYNYQDLVVHRNYFTVNLKFNGIIENIKVPLSSIVSFVDTYNDNYTIDFDHSVLKSSPKKPINNVIHIKDLKKK